VKEPSSFEHRELIVSQDGSSSLYLPGLDETYHNRRGALTESEFIFIEKGLKNKALESSGSAPIRVLEVGMGTGLNVLLTQRFADSTSNHVEMVTLEPYPLTRSEWEALNYGDLVNMKAEIRALHEAGWEQATALSPHFTITKLKTKLENMIGYEGSFDVIYMDAFAPSRQAEIWSRENLTRLYNSLGNDGHLVTYCAQGQFKRDLKEVGFLTEHPPGPLGKKEMTIARKKA